MNDSISAPKLATLLLSLFASEPDFPQIEGDLREEFHNRLVASGPTLARRWYWREVRRNLWALLKRPRAIQVFAVAALSVLVFKFSVGPFFQWLQVQLYSAPRVPGLRLVLMAVFETAIALLLGMLMSRFVKARERMLRVAFTALFLLFLIRNYLLIAHFDTRILLSSVSSALVLIAFWMGSLWISRRGFRRQAA
jgi:hypothetical protein